MDPVGMLETHNMRCQHVVVALFCVCLARFLFNTKTANAQFAKPQAYILQSNRSVQSTAETSYPPCSVAVALRAIGDASLSESSVAVQSASEHQESLSESSVAVQSASGG